MPTREPPRTHGSRGNLQTRPPGPGPPRLVSRGLKPSAPPTVYQPQPGAHRTKPKKIVFEDELPSRALLGTKKSTRAICERHVPRPHPVPDYELKYPPVSTAKDRSRYAAVFQDQYPEFLELQQEVGSAQAKLQQLEALLNSLPRPRSQVSTRWKPSPYIPCKWPKPGLWKPNGFRSLGLFLVQAGRAPHHMGQGQPLTRSTLSEPVSPSLLGSCAP
uniref:Occludin/ELL domain containing 1 n=1 Tax=Bos indicus x Bos taurus TaxID=30522 RepID=A0A4W2EY62_BOBOX